jgi:hypothetical protein
VTLGGGEEAKLHPRLPPLFSINPIDCETKMAFCAQLLDQWAFENFNEKRSEMRLGPRVACDEKSSRCFYK